MTKKSGENIGEWQRRTASVKVRLAPDVAKLLRARAEKTQLSLSDYVTQLVQSDARIGIEEAYQLSITRMSPSEQFNSISRLYDDGIITSDEVGRLFDID